MKKLILILALVLLVGCIAPKTEESGKDGSAPLEIIEFGKGIPEGLKAGEQVALSATIKASQPVKNAIAEFYDFGPYLIGCPPANIGSIDKEDKTAMCKIQIKRKIEWPDKSKISFSQAVKMKVKYGYEPFVALDDIKVLSEDEMNRAKPTVSSKTKEVSGPLSLNLEVKNQPARSDATFAIYLTIKAAIDNSKGIEVYPTSDGSYHIKYVQLQLPPSFSIYSMENFDEESKCNNGKNTCLQKNYLKLENGEATLRAVVKSPHVTVPQETFSVVATASGFSVFEIREVAVTASAQ